MILFIIFFVINSFAKMPQHWSSIYEIQDRHEFYQNNETIIKPKDSWQSLFSLVYIDRDFISAKDCLFYKVPGLELGKIKIKTIPSDKKCDEYLLVTGDKEFKEIKSLNYSIETKEILINFTKNDGKLERWIVSMLQNKTHSESLLGLSSAEFKSPKIIFLSAKTNLKSSSKNKFLDKDAICHEVNEDCQVIGSSVCHRCENGWYEIPNGCLVGPKFCGALNCGGKNKPACRRGMTWQRTSREFDCRTDSSFSYCSKGLAVTCEGRKAFCR